MKWAFVFLVLIGDVLVVKKNRMGFFIWILVDGFFCFTNGCQGDWPEFSIFGMYALIGIYGAIAWKEKKEQS